MRASSFIVLMAAAVALSAVAAVLGGCGVTSSDPVDLSRVEYVQSGTCIRCHPDHHASWQRTFHRTMTQAATPATVLGDFDGARYTYAGVESRFLREGDRFFIETMGPAGDRVRYAIELAVGSRRFQQYMARVGDRHFRVPLAWDITERHWFHLAGGFLHPDGSDFNAHLSLWDANCIFCHNTKPNPSLEWGGQTFDARVAELGIACEACHGPGQEHIARNANPIHRYAHYLGGRDASIVSPLELTKERQVQVCGHCHGQRKPNPESRLREFLAAGDPYTAGDDLTRFTAPIWQDSHLEGIDLSLRFWGDGTARLTAYEYQGVLQSPCYQRGEMTCISCHTMHGGDPRGMIEEAMRGMDGCLQCHPKYAADIKAHTKHEPAGSGSDCYACHMPDVTYGLVGMHPTHRVDNPDPARAWRHDMPEACTLCHTNRTARWAAEKMSEQYDSPRPESPPGDAQWEVAENVRALLAGDVVQRAAAVHAFANAETYTADAVAALWAAPLLVRTMDDDYPAVRRMAYRALRELVSRARSVAGGASGEDEPGAPFAASLAAGEAIPAFDPLADAPVRAEVVEAWRAWWRALDASRIPHPGEAVPLDDSLRPIQDVVEDLIRRQSGAVIAIGE